MSGATKTMARVIRTLMRLLKTVIIIPQPAAQTACVPSCGIIGPKNGIPPAFVASGNTRKPTTNRDANKDTRERISLSYRACTELVRLSTHAGPLGIGPRLSVLETDVLPLYDGPVQKR